MYNGRLSIAPSLELKQKNATRNLQRFKTINRTISGIETVEFKPMLYIFIGLSIAPSLELKLSKSWDVQPTCVPINRTISGIETAIYACIVNQCVLSIAPSLELKPVTLRD